MANRFPLVIDTSDGNKFKELPDGDNLILTNSSIVDALNVDVRGTVETQQIIINGVNFTGSYPELTNKPDIPDDILDLVSDGSLGQVLTTNGSGLVSFQNIPQQDPVLGGDLEGTASDATIKSNTISVDQLDVDDGAIGQVLATDGSGNLQFITISGTNGGTGASNFLELGGEIAYGQIPDNIIDIQKLDVADGTNGQILSTDGSGNLLFVDLPDFVTDYNDLTNKPSIPETLTDLGISDGTSGQILSANGNNSYSFIDFDSIENVQFSGTTITTVNDNSNIALDPKGNGYVSVVGTNGLVIPSGGTAERNPALTGSIRYNTDLAAYEGFDGVNWNSLGGVRDVDGDTYISTESVAGADEDELRFFTGGLNAATLTNSLLEFDNSVSVKIKNTEDALDFDTGALSVDGGVSIKGNLVVSGNISVNTEFQTSIIADATMTSGELTNVVEVSSEDIEFFRTGQTVRIFGASSTDQIQTQDGLSVSVSPIGFAEADPGTGIVYSYRVAQFDLTTGKISASVDPVSLELENSSVNNFNNSQNIQVLVSRQNAAKGILVYRKVGSEVDFKLVKILGPKELEANTSNIAWIDYYDFDLTPWSGKDASNAFIESSGVVHMPITASIESKLGWFDTEITGIDIESRTITTQESFYAEDSGKIVHDDSTAVQLLIDAAKAQDKNVLTLNNRDYYISRITLPNNFTLKGSGDQTRIIKQYWSADLLSGNNHIFDVDDEADNFDNISVKNIKIDGNAQSQYLSQDASNQSLNYIVKIYGKDILFESVEITNVIGGGIWAYDPSFTEDLSILNCEITNGSLTYLYDYSPLNASESRSVKIAHNTFRNFTSAVDVGAVLKGIVSPNIVDNCGSGIFAFGASKIVLSPNVLLGPAGEFIPNPDVLNSEYDAININIEPGADFNSPQYVYQENGDNLDFTVFQRNLTGLINELIKVNGVEEISTDYSETLAGTDYIQFTNDGDSEGAFAFRITAARVNDLLSRASYSTLFSNNENTQGLVYRIVCTEYVPQNNIIGQGTQSPGGSYTVPVDTVEGFIIGSVVRLVGHSTTPSTTGVDGTITAINTLNKTLSIDFGDSFGDITTPGNSGTVNLQNNFVVAKGKIN